MRDLVRDPQRQQLGRESHAVCLRVRPAGEVLQADERNAAASDDELAGVRGAHADHQVQIDRTIGLEHFSRAPQRLFGHGDHVDVRERAPEIGAVGVQRRGDDRLGMRRFGVEHVVLPVRAEHGTVAIEILVVRRGRIGRGERREELRNEIDEHCPVADPIWERSRPVTSAAIGW